MVSKNRGEVKMEYAKVNEETMAYLKRMGELDQEKTQAFMNFMETAEGGKLDAKTKELIALGIAIKAQCHYCIAFHVQNALKAGVTKEEIVETIWMSTLMGGGPSLMYGKEALDAVEEFSK